MANWKQRHLASAIVLRTLWTAKTQKTIFFQWIMILLKFPKVISDGKPIGPVENYANQSAQKENTLASL